MWDKSGEGLLLSRRRYIASEFHPTSPLICSLYTVASHSPGNITVTRFSNIILITWQPLTLLEARGFIEYVVDLHIMDSLKRQALSKRVPMNQSNVTFTGLNPNQVYEATVGTRTLFTGMRGPISKRLLERVVMPTPEDSHNSVITAVSVLFIVTVLIVTIAVVVIILGRSRRSTLDLTRDLQ